MKKLVFIAVLGVASSLASYGQQVFFNNYYSSTQTTGVTFGGGPLAGQGVGSEFTAQLFYGPAGTLSTSSLTPTGSPTAFATSLGYSPTLGGPIGGGDGSGWFGSGATLPAYNTTYAMAYFVTGTYQGVVYSGWSPIVNALSQISAGNAIPQLPDSLRKITFSISGAPVPEPTTLALAGLGLASLVALRRKQS
jgi:PEP-CTERM motif